MSYTSNKSDFSRKSETKRSPSPLQNVSDIHQSTPSPSSSYISSDRLSMKEETFNHDRVFTELFKSKKEVFKTDAKAKAALETWKTAFFSMIHNVKLGLFKKKKMVHECPWLSSGSIPADLLKKDKNRRMKQTKYRDSDSDASSFDLEGFDSSSDPSAIKSNYSRLLLLIARNLRELNEHMNIILRIHDFLKKDQSLSNSQMNVEDNREIVNEKNPLWRSLAKLSNEEREKLISFCQEEIDLCKKELEDVDHGITNNSVIDEEKDFLRHEPPTSPTLENKIRRKQFEKQQQQMDSVIPLEDVESGSRLSGGWNNIKETIVDRISVSMNKEDTVSKDLETVRVGHEVMDDELNNVSHKVTHLKVIARDIDTEVNRQNAIVLPALQEQTEKVDLNLAYTHGKVKKVLEKLRSGKLWTYCILSLVLLILLVVLLKIIFNP